MDVIFICHYSTNSLLYKLFFFFSLRPPPSSTRSDTLFPYTTLVLPAGGNPRPARGQAQRQLQPQANRQQQRAEDDEVACDPVHATVVEPHRHQRQQPQRQRTAPERDPPVLHAARTAITEDRKSAV